MSSLKLRATADADDIKPTTAIAIRTSYAAWWLKNPPKTWKQKQLQLQLQNQQQQQRKQSFSQDMGDLFRNVAMHGYNKLLDPELTLFEKLIWLSFHVTSMVTLCIVLSYTWEHFVAQYFVINLHDPLYPVENIPFPAVSICSNNRISQRAALEYAKELQAQDPQHRELEYFMSSIKGFTRLYYRYINFMERGGEDYTNENHERYLEFQDFLEDYGINGNETFYDTKKIMKRLTPSCKDYLVQCLLAGIEIDCFSPVAFDISLTTYGPCCTFNTKNSYRRRSSENSYVSPDLGLTVVLNTSHADDFSEILRSNGYAVVIYDSDVYPDIASGGPQEVLPNEGEEVFVSIKPRLIDTAEALRSYGPTTRKCYFDNEAPSPDMLVRNSYSFTNCLTRCRIRSIRALCNCMPFFLPMDLVDTPDGLIYCTLQHTNCLLRYTFKWRNVLTLRQNIPELRHEIEESLYCPACLPSCEDVQYQVSLMSLPLDRFRSSTNYNRLQNKGLDLKNISVLRVHFGEPHALYYRRIIGNGWYEVMSTVGNILSIFLGFSMVTIFEILFIFAKHALIAAKMFITQNTKRDKHRHHRHSSQHQEKFVDNKLYIYP